MKNGVNFFNEVTTLVLWVFSNGFDSPGQTIHLLHFFSKQNRLEWILRPLPSGLCKDSLAERLTHIAFEATGELHDYPRFMKSVILREFFVKNENCFTEKKIMFTGKNREIVGKDS